MAKHLNSYEVQLDFRADTSQAKKELQQFQQSLDQLVNTGLRKYSFGQDITKDLGKATNTVMQLKENLQQAFNVDTGKLDLGKFQESMRRSGNDLQSYKAALTQLGPEGKKAFDQLVNSISNAEVPLKRSNALLTEFWTTLKNTARWQISSSLLHGFMSSIQGAYRYAQDLNESLNNIRIVTGYNTDKMAQFAASANKAAQALSTTTTAYTDAALIYYQQGLGDEEVLGRTDVTVKMANVSRQSAEEVSDQLTAIWNNFYDGSKSLEYYADVITALGAATASSSEEISTGLEKFAAVADTVGLSYEYATAALATITATTRQSAETVGTGLRTLFARLEGLKLGETLEDGVDLNKYSKALKTIGVDILDVNGEIKDMDTILNETAAGWDRLSKAQQVAFAQTVGGVRQYTNLIALMDNWDFMQSNLEVAGSAEGTLEKQSQIYADSWEAAQKRVKAAMEDIYGALLNDKFFIELNNILADALKTIKNFITAIGGLKGTLSALGAVAFTVFKQQIGSSIDDALYSMRMATGGITRANAFKESAIAMRAQSTEGMGDVQADVYARNIEMEYNAEKAYLKIKDQLSERQQQDYKKQLEINQAEHEREETLAKEVDHLQNILDKENLSLSDDKIKRLIGPAEGIGLLEGRDEQWEAWSGRSLDARVKQNRGITDLRGTVFKELFGDQDGYETLKEGLPDELMADLEKLYQWTQGAKGITNGTASEAMNNIYSHIGAKYKFQEAAQELAKEDLAGKENEADYNEQLEKRTQYYEQLGRDAAALRQKQEELNSSTQKTAQSYEALNKSWDQIRKQGYTAGQSITAVSGALMSYSSAISTVKGLKDLWSNDDISTGQKVVQTISSMSMVLMMLTRYRVSDTLAHMANIVEEIKGTFAKTANTTATKVNTAAKKENAAASGEQAAAETTETAATEANTAAKTAGAAASKKLNAAMLSNLQLLGALAALLYFVGGMIYTVIKAVDDENHQLNDAQESVTDLKTSYEEATSAAKEFKDTIADYQEGLDGLDKLKKGTDEYKEALEQSNEQAKKLIETYGLFDQYTTKNGKIVFNEGVLESVQANLDNQANIRRQAYLESAVYSANLQKSQDISEAKKSSGIKDDTTWNVLYKEYKNYIDEFGHTVDNADTFSKYLEESKGIVLNGVEITDKVINSLTDYHEALDKNTKAVDYYTKELVKNKLITNAETNEKLIQQSTFNGKFNQEYYNSLTEAHATLNSSNVGDISHLADQISHVNSANTLTSFFGKNYDLKQIQDVLGEGFDYSLGNEDMAQYYAKLMNGGNLNQYSSSVKDGKATVVDSITGETVVDAMDLDLLYQTMSRVVAQSIEDGTANASLNESLTKVLDNVDALGLGSRLQQELGQIINEGIASGGVFDFSSFVNSLSQDEVNALDPQAIANMIGLTPEKLAELGIEDSEAFTKAFEEAIEGWNLVDYTDSINAEYKKKAEDLDLDVDAFEAYKRILQETNPELAKNVELLNKVAIADKRVERGAKTLIDNWEEWNEIITRVGDNSQDLSTILPKVEEALADIANVNIEDIQELDPSFISENWDLITQSINGSETALDELQAKIAEVTLNNWIAEIGIDDAGAIAEIQSLHDEITSFNDFPIEVPIDNEDFINACNDMILAAQMTEEQAQEYFSKLGFDATFKTQKQPVTEWVPNYESRYEVVEEGEGYRIQKKGTNVTWERFDGEVEVPAIETITPNKSYGGNIKKLGGGGGGPKKSGGGGGGGKSSPAENQKITSKDDAGIKRYKEIDDAIQDLTKDQERLNKVTDAYYGANKVAYMKQQQKLLQKEIDLHKERFKWAQKYYEEDKAELDNYAKEKLGVEIEYDEDGSIKNYTSIMDQLYSQLNEKESYWANASNFSSKEAQDEYKKNNIDPIADTMKTFQGYVDQFDESNEERKKEMNEGIELMIEFKQHEYEIWQEGWKNQQDILEDQIKFLDHAKKMLGDSAADMGEALALTAGGDNNYVQNALDQLSLYNDKEQELHNLLAENKITQANYVKGMEEIRDVYLEQTENLKALDDEMMEYYGKVLDKVISEIKEYTDAMGKLNDQLDRYMKVMKLTGRELDYDAIGEILEAQQKVLQDQYTTDLSTLEMLREREQHWIQELKNQDTKEGRELIERQLKETREQILETENQVLDDLAAQAEKAAEILENARAKSMAVYEDMLTDGLGFDYIDGLLERQSTIQEEYLTKTNQVFETTKMLRKIQTDMDSTSNRAAKERLNNFSKEIENLKNRDKMTKADLELAQKRYDLLLAQIALEEAQKAKTTVRLQRDNEGNYGYVYTADEGDIAKAEDDMFNAENDLYNTRLRIANEYGEKIIQLNQEQADALNELWDEYYNKHSISEDEYEQKRAEIVEHYNELRKTYVHNYTEAQKEDARVVADAWINQDQNMIKSSTEWQKTTDKLIYQTETAIRRYENTSDWLERQQERHLGNVREETEKVTTASDELKNKVNDEVIPAYDELWEKVDAVYKKYSAERSEILKNITAYTNLANSLQNTINKYRELATVSDIKTLNSDGDKKDTSIGVKEISSNPSVTTGNNGDKDKNSSYVPSDNLNKQEVKKIEQKPAQDATLQAYLSTLNSNPAGLSDAGITYIVNKLGANSTAGKNALAIRSKRDEYNHLVSLGDNLIKNKTKYQRFQTLAAEKAAGKFNTGGYTGEWNDGSGKLAVLHSKELVLNAKDTENMLAVVDMVRQITNSIDMNAASLAGGYGALSSGGSGATGPQTLEQNVQINASFPNATNHSEIEEAFNNLINKASQYASRTR